MQKCIQYNIVIILYRRRIRRAETEWEKRENRAREAHRVYRCTAAAAAAA